MSSLLGSSDRTFRSFLSPDLLIMDDLETWPETPILSERSFTQRRLSMVCWFSETFIIRHYAL